MQTAHALRVVLTQGRHSAVGKKSNVEMPKHMKWRLSWPGERHSPAPAAWITDSIR